MTVGELIRAIVELNVHMDSEVLLEVGALSEDVKEVDFDGQYVILRNEVL